MNRLLAMGGALTAVALASAVLAPAAAAQPAAAAAPATSFHVAANKHSLTDSAGTTWQPDGSYAHGGAVATSSHAVGHSASPALYRGQRTGVTSYSFPVSAV